MKILPVFLNTQNILITKTNNNIGPFSKNRYNTESMLAPLACDTITFSGSRRKAQNAEALRALMAYDIPDMYSGKIVIEPQILENFYSRHVFSRAIKNVIKLLIPYEKSMHTVEKEFFSIVKNMAKTEPQYKLEDVVRKIAPEHNKKLLSIQEPIFKDLIELSKKMPEDKQQDFKLLMNIIYKKLRFEPIALPFSSKEFQYKLQRIADETGNKNNMTELNILKRMIQVAKLIPEKTEEEINDSKEIKSKVKRNKKIKVQKGLIKKRADLLTQIEIMRAGTSLENNQELNRLLAQTRSKIYNMPIVIPFNRKSFIYELQKITNTLEDKKLAHKIIQKAIELPTSHTCLSALVMKCIEYSSDKIGYSLISGSVGSIDHLIPFVKKGKDCIENYGISSAYYNSERAERSIAQQLKKHPQTYQNCQKQIDRLIELCNKGIFKKVGLPKHYIINFAKRMFELSPKDNKLILDISKLR